MPVATRTASKLLAAVSAGRSSDGRRRRRRTPEVAQREIIEAAEELLRERPFRELTVDEVMRRTELSRPSFYVYFRDRHELVLRVVEHCSGGDAGDRRPLVRGHGRRAGGAPRGARGRRRRCTSATAPVLRALADAAVEDPDVEERLRRARAGLHRRDRASTSSARSRPGKIAAARRRRDRAGADLDDRALPATTRSAATPPRRPRARRRDARDDLDADALRRRS